VQPQGCGAYAGDPSASAALSRIQPVTAVFHISRRVPMPPGHEDHVERRMVVEAVVG
jgi:hypothetical protein